MGIVTRGVVGRYGMVTRGVYIYITGTCTPSIPLYTHLLDAILMYTYIRMIAVRLPPWGIQISRYTLG